MASKNWADICDAEDEKSGGLTSQMTQLGVSTVPSTQSLPTPPVNTQNVDVSGTSGGGVGVGGNNLLDESLAPQPPQLPELPPLGDITEALIREKPMVSRREVFYLDGNPIDSDDPRLVKNWEVTEAHYSFRPYTLLTSIELVELMSNIPTIPIF